MSVDLDHLHTVLLLLQRQALAWTEPASSFDAYLAGSGRDSKGPSAQIVDTLAPKWPKIPK